MFKWLTVVCFLIAQPANAQLLGEKTLEAAEECSLWSPSSQGCSTQPHGYKWQLDFREFQQSISWAMAGSSAADIFTVGHEIHELWPWAVGEQCRVCSFVWGLVWVLLGCLSALKVGAVSAQATSLRGLRQRLGLKECSALGNLLASLPQTPTFYQGAVELATEKNFVYLQPL